MLFLFNLIFAFKIGNDFIVSSTILNSTFNINNNVNTILYQFKNLRAKFRNSKDKKNHQILFQKINEIIQYIEAYQNGHTLTYVQFDNHTINDLQNKINEYNEMVGKKNFLK